MIPAGYGNSDHQIVLAAQPVQERINGCQQNRERRIPRSHALPETLELPRPFRAEAERKSTAVQCLKRRPLIIRGQIERRKRGGEMVLPPCKVLVKSARFQLPVLPCRDIAILK